MSKSKHKKHEHKGSKKDNQKTEKVTIENTKKVVHSAQDTSKEVAHDTEKKINKVGEDAKKVAESASKKANDIIHDTEEKFDEVSKDAMKFADTATKRAKEIAHDAEEKIDEATKKAKAYVSGQGKEDFKELEKETVSKVNKVADGVEHLGEGYEDLVESIFPSDHVGSRIVYNAEWKEDVDRWVVVRLLWCIVLWPVMIIRGARIALIRIVFMVKIITTGKRDRVLWNKMIRFANYILNRDAYIGGLIDRRPEIIE